MLVALALVVMVPALGALQTGQWLRMQFSSGLALAANLGEQLEPAVVIVMTPVVEEAVDAVAATNVETVALADAPVAAAAPTVKPTGEPTVEPTVAAETPAEVAVPTVEPPTPAAPTEVPTEVVLPTPTMVPTATPIPTDTPAPMPTDPPPATPAPAATAGAGIAAQAEQESQPPTPTWTPLPTVAGVVAMLPTPTPATGLGGPVGAIAVAAEAPVAADTPTPSPTPQVHAVKAGDTLVSIAAAYAVDVDALMAVNGIAASEVYVIQPGQLLIIPRMAATATPGPSPTPRQYQVQPGDTLVSIAARYGVSTAALMAANGISAQAAYVLQPGQALVIPAEDTAPAAATPSVPAAAATSPAGVPGVVRLDAPVLLSPESGTPMSCDRQSTLTWDRVQFIRDDDKYVLHLGFVSGRTAGGEDEITWVLAQPRPATQTSWDLDASLCGLAPQAYGRQWRWWVEVVAESDGDTLAVSPPSPVWSFSWN